jgi:ATP-dependent helicase/nuclease subunit B
MAGLDVTDVDPSHFEVGAKGNDLCQILEEYLREIRQRGLVDYAEVLRIAVEQVQADPGLLPERTVVVLPEDLSAGALEQRLLNILPDDRKLFLPFDEPVDEQARPEPVPSDMSLMRWLPRAADAPQPVGDGTVGFFQAVGEVNEVREVLRRLISEGVGLDQAELLYTEGETYAPLIYETFAALLPDNAQIDDELPVTFAEGIPSRFFRPGRLLAAWTAWVLEDFPQSRLVGMIREGLLTSPELDEKRFSFSRLAAVLRQVGIGFGCERYLPKLDEEIAARRRHLEDLGRARDEDGEADEAKHMLLSRQVEELGVLRDLVRTVVELSVSRGSPQQAILDSAIHLLEIMSRAVNKSDNYARMRLIQDIAEMRSWFEEEGAGLDVWQWLANLPDRSHVLGSGPRPGRLHVANVTSGGHTGRPYTFIVGLDDGRFPGTGSQDPLLLDSERQKISDSLPTASSDLEERIREFYQLLVRLRGKLVLSFPGHDLIDDREKFPSPLLLAVFRLVSGNREAAQEDFRKWLPPAASFAPLQEDRCLNISDWWLHQLCCKGPVDDAIGQVMNSFPHLAQGSEAMERRFSSEFTPYDGRVEAAGVDLDPTAPEGPIMSSGRLEQIGQCPLAFFFQRGLKIAPPEELDLDPARWLDPLAYGSLLHEVFEHFVRELVEEGQLPRYPEDFPRLEAILETKVQEYREEYPPPNEHSYRTQRAELHRVARTFLTEEAQFCLETGSTPAYLEATLGMGVAGEGTQIDTDQPILIPLPGGRSIRVRGRIDRIDKVGADTGQSYAIWDYKSGSAWKYDEQDPFRQGRVIQPGLYVAMVTHRLREAVSKKAKVIQFGFFFPGVRERGRRIRWSPAELREGGAVLQRLVEIVRNGAFVATDNVDDCRFCDYRAICRDCDALARATQEKLSGPDRTVLRAFRELRGYGEG